MFYLSVHKISFYDENEFYNFVVATQTPISSEVFVEGIAEPTTVWDVLATDEEKAKVKATNKHAIK